MPFPIPRTALVAAMVVGAVTVGACSQPTVTVLHTLELEPLTQGAQGVSLGELRGKVVLINFWGTWCPPCREEFPHVAAIERQYRGRSDFRMLSVSCPFDSSEGMESLRAGTERFLGAGGYDMPAYADPRGTTRGALHVNAYPATFLVNRDGTIAETFIGFDPREFESLKLRIASLLQAEAK